MMLQKTEKARAELQPGVRTLGQRERTLLLLADGSKTLQDFRPLFDGDGEKLALHLVRDGYLRGASLAKPALQPTRAAQSSGAVPMDRPPAPAEREAPKAAADPFEGKRSLATTRMFLFDICERTFAKRDPQKAELLREALRNARDREAMLAAGRELVAEIEKIAGPDRADSISERIAMLLPPETYLA